MSIELTGVSPSELIAAALALALFVKLVQLKGWPQFFRGKSSIGDAIRRLLTKQNLVLRLRFYRCCQDWRGNSATLLLVPILGHVSLPTPQVGEPRFTTQLLVAAALSLFESASSMRSLAFCRNISGNRPPLVGYAPRGIPPQFQRMSTA